MRAPRWPDWLFLEIRHAGRALLRRPGFAAAAALTLALGTGAGTAIFSVVYGVLIRELPYRDAEQLVLVQVRVRTTGEVMPLGFSASDLDEWRKRSRALQSLALCERDLVALDSNSGFETLGGAYVSSQFFAVLGVRTALGRLPGDPAAHEIVISDGLWRRRFGSDPRVVGRQVRLDSGMHTIVGVVGPSVTFPVQTRSRIGAPPDPPDLWVPVGASERWPADSPLGQIVARLAPNLPLEQARTDVHATARAFAANHPDWAESYEAVLLSLPEDLTGPLRPALWLLLGAVGCVLLVACTNVANLLLARQTARTREVALRISLGAPRHRLVVHALSEAALIALVGGGCGIVLASWLVAALRWLEPADLPRLDAIRVDVPVLLFALGISAVSALLSAAAPAWRLIAAGGTLHSGAEGRSLVPGRKARRTRSALVVAELAISLVLLVGATLLTRSFVRLIGTDIGVARDHVVTVELNTMGAPASPVRQIQLADQVVAMTRAVPGVRAAGVANGLPPNRSRMRVFIQMPDRTGRPVSMQFGMLNPTPEFFSALAIPLLRGRTFTPADGANAPPVVVLDASAARRLFGTLDCIGKIVPVGRKGTRATVVGVVGSVKYHGLDGPVGETLYAPFPQYPFRNMVLVARTAGDPSQLAGSLPKVVHDIDRDISVGPVRTLDDVVSEAVARQQFRTALFGSSPASALALAGSGRNGVIVATVTLRANLLPYWVCHDSWAFASEAGRCQSRPHSADRGWRSASSCRSAAQRRAPRMSRPRPERPPGARSATRERVSNASP